MDNKIKSLSILDDSDKTLFDKDKYIIPLYQRAFAWSDKEICQLIDDINDFSSAHYYLGSLIVNLNKDGVYEVIDGQQRLTALFLLLDFVGKNDWGADRLSYECRERSNFTLNNLSQINNDTLKVYLANPEKTLIDGRKIISDKFDSDKINKDQFISKLKNVILYRIEVPPHTDLNRYFEIMNVRGEQLEQHDILKAKLMEPLDEKSRTAFAIVWDACRDMTGYVQMHFQKNDRETLFYSGWDKLNLDKYDSLCKKKDITLTSLSVVDIIKQDTLPYTIEGYDESGTRVRFKSIIGFPHFLLHVLKVFASTELDKDSYSIPKQLDDKKLLEIFSSVINSAKQNNRQVDKKYFSQAFIKCLLKCRFLFDKYIIKREYKYDDENGDWSLKELKVSGAKSQKKPYYKDTYFGEHNEWEKTYAPRTRINLMLQSCMCVSYTSPKTMHWITKLLSWLYDDNNIQKKLSSFQDDTEKIAKDEVKSFIKNKDNYRQGVKTPHIVLNYLDYLLWTKRNEEKYQNLKFDQFSFEYRNSVEHWYPQHPSKESFVRWDDFDRFGNLCIIQRNINSKFSNLSPVSKKNTYGQMIEKGSLKLRLMSALTKDDTEWINKACEEHETEMLNLLKNACEIPTTP